MPFNSVFVDVSCVVKLQRYLRPYIPLTCSLPFNQANYTPHRAYPLRPHTCRTCYGPARYPIPTATTTYTQDTPCRCKAFWTLSSLTYQEVPSSTFASTFDIDLLHLPSSSLIVRRLVRLFQPGKSIRRTWTFSGALLDNSPGGPRLGGVRDAAGLVHSDAIRLTWRFFSP